MKKSTILFDMDGTLVPFESADFLKLYFGGISRKLALLGYEPKAAVADILSGTEAMVGNDGSRRNSEAFWEVFYAANSDKPDARPFCDEFYAGEFDDVKACLKEKRDLKPMISELKSAGFDLILSTNSVFPRSAMLTRLGWVNLDESDFSFITDYDNSSYCKPNPAFFSEILEKTGKTADECIVVGNHIKEDILPAKSLGIAVFYVTDYPENPDNADVSEFESGSLAQAKNYLLSLV